MKTFDIIVIGAGSGGLNVASFMNRIGFSVLLIDRSDEMIGGDCLNHGCVPSKALIHVSRLVARGKEAEQFGITQNGAVDLAAVMAYVRERQDVIREHENAEYFRKKGITVTLGDAKFVSEDSVEVAGEIYRGKRIVIATGSRPRTLDIPGSENVPMYTNETIFSMTELPKNLVVIGGGPIGFELGQAFSRLGSRVTIVNRDDTWLSKEHRSVAAVLMEHMKKEGVTFIPNAAVTEITEEKMLRMQTVEGTKELSCDALFIGIGRIPNLETLNLKAAGIGTDDHGKLMLDSFLRTSNKRVFAVGDVISQHQFTHAAEVHASLVLSNFFKPRVLWKKLTTDHMAWVTYTDPEIATFGLSEEELGKRGISFEVIEESFRGSDRAITDDRTEGLIKLHISPRGTILGGTMVGENAGELVGELILANTHGMRLQDIFARVFPYPTAARINRVAAAPYLGRSLTPTVKRVLKLLY